MKLFNLLNTALFGLCLTACGGGGSSQPSPQINTGSSIITSSASSDVSSASSDVSSVSSDVSSVSSDVSSASSEARSASSDVGSASSEASSDGNKKSVTISGSVFNGAYISNADITVTAGDETFNAKTNATGQYSVLITVSKKNLTVPIKIVATGDAKYPGTILATQLESPSRLLEQAGFDKVLDATENPATNISSLTTAEYAFLTVPTKWGYVVSISTDAELKEVRQLLSTNRKIIVAAYLEITATDSRFKLPAAYKNTLEFAKDQASFDTFGAQVFENDDTIIGTVSERIKKTNNVTYGGPDHAGTYILYDATSGNSYLLKLNADASGELTANDITTPLTWSKDNLTVTLKFLTPVPTNESDYSGKWFMTGAEISVHDQYSNTSYADLLLSESLIDQNGKTLYDQQSYLRVSIYEQANFIAPPLDKITGEWIVSEGTYQINANGTGSFKPFTLDTQTEFSWNLKDGTLSLKKDDGRVENINFVQDLGVGYAYVKTDDRYFKYDIRHGILVKPMPNLTFSNSDLVGNWIDGGSYIQVMTSDGRVLTNFGSSDLPWVLNETNDGWSQNGYKLDTNEWTQSCEVAQGTNIDCRLFKTFTNKIIAVEGSNYYFLRTDKVYFDPANPSVNYSLVLSKKLPEVNYFANWIKNRVTMPFYHVDGSSTKVWNFSGNKLVVSDKSLFDSVFSDDETTFAIKNNRLQYVRDNVALELELIQASEEGLMVCEFTQGSSCATGTKFLLSNKSPAKISLKVNGSGSITPHSSNSYWIFPDGLFGNVVTYRVTPDAGSVVKSVTGCGGKLDYSNIYVTAEIREACTITATFKPIE
jgi:hypothetical protein